MKKTVLVLVLVLLATGAFAQLGLSVEGQVSRYGNSTYFDVLAGQMASGGGGGGPPQLNLPNAIPGINVAYDLGFLEILAGVEFWRVGIDFEMGPNSKVKPTFFILGISAGVAPKIAAGEKVSLSFPVLFKFSRIGFKYEETVPGNTDTATWGLNSFGLDLGARAYYSVTDNWSIFGGFRAEAFKYYANPTVKFTSGGGGSITVTPKHSAFQLFSNGSIDFGIRFSL